VATDDKTDFERWFAKVDALVAARAGLGADDLPDQPYYDWFDSEWTPKEAAQEVLATVADEMGFEGLFG
jgi:hypothetical protein